MPQSHHSHSGQFCKHAVGTLEEVVLEAIRRGFETYGLTEHVPRYRDEDMYPEEKGLSSDDLVKQFDSFLTEAHRLKASYAPRIALLVGLETEYITSIDMDHLEDFLEHRPGQIEYIVGSVHHVNRIPIDFDLPTSHKALASFDGGPPPNSAFQQMECFLSSYFDAQYEILHRLHPEVIGHIDLCRLYNPDLQLQEYPKAWKKLERNVDYAISYGALFEVNAAAFRKGWSTAYPGADVMQLIQRRQGRFALSDDSHGPHAVALNYKRLADYLRRVGVTELWFLASDSAVNGRGRPVAAQKIDGCWWEHPFWRDNFPAEQISDV